MASFLVRPRRKKFRVGFVVVRDGDGHLFQECSLLPFCMSGNFLSFFLSCHWIGVIGPAVFCGVAGCLGSILLVSGTPGLPPLVSWLVERWSAVSVLILWIVQLLDAP